MLQKIANNLSGTWCWPYFLASTVLLLIACRCSPALQYRLKYSLYHLIMIVIFGLALIPCLLRPGNSDNIVIGRAYYHIFRFVWWMLGFSIVTEGKENLDDVTAPAVFMCNHQSSLDALVIAKDAPRPTGSLAKKSLLYIPIFGFAAWLAGTVFIDRKSYTAIHIMQELVGKLKRNKTNIWIFPEGTRSQKDTLLPFKKGGFHLAVQAQIPIVPVVIGNCRNFLDIPNKVFNSGTLRVRILPQIETTGLTKDNVTDLSNKCRDVMLAAYNQITEDYKEEYVNMLPLPDLQKNE